MRPIRQILIANRGEIAVRIIKTCREMGIRSVAVFSDADRDAPHVRLADKAFHIGAPPARESYLNQEKIIEVAQRSGSDAVHPGYGFLSENASFAQRVIDERLVFIGPTPAAMALMGSKTSARRLARSIGIPIVPGSSDAIGSTDDASVVAREIGYPVLLKASGGGGGKGMRLVRSASELSSAYASARSEARSAFNDDRVYIEKYIDSPRHVEVQVFGDAFGNVVHIGERECSIQRRHQKIIEESPSCVVDDSLREAITSAAVLLAKAGNYSNAGTMEFILDDEKRFYFLEMNSRLQVEHPVTEMRTGIDIVREQISVAEGRQLSLSQDGIRFSGHSIECRIYAEDSFNGFYPSTGRIVHLRTPSGFGIREERGVEEGSNISTYYDPMLAKLIVWGNDRKSALARMVGALNQYEVYGVRSNIDLCLWILNHPKFRDGDFNTHFLDQNFSPDEIVGPCEEYLQAAASAAFHLDQRVTPMSDQNETTRQASRWRTKRMDWMR